MKKVPENYQDASDIVRNIADLGESYEVIEELGKFRIVRLNPPYYAGSEFWVVNDKGFLWESAVSVDAAREYLNSDEARTYQTANPPNDAP